MRMDKTCAERLHMDAMGTGGESRETVPAWIELVALCALLVAVLACSLRNH